MDNLKVMFEEVELQKRIKEVAEEIDKDYVGKDEIVVVSVLKGAIFFTVDLVKKMKTPIELEGMQVSSYVGTQSTGKLNVKKADKIDSVLVNNYDLFISKYTKEEIELMDKAFKLLLDSFNNGKEI